MTASKPLIVLSLTWFLLRHVSTAFPTGFLYKIEIWISPLVIAEEMKSKFGVLPFIIDPMAINPSYFFIFLATTTGISNAPGTSNILKLILL